MKLLRRLRYMLGQRRRERDLAEEIEFHRAMNTDPLEMGNITLAREDARAVWIWPWVQSVWQDAAYALRNLRRQPGFTVVALLTLGTAIGLNTSFFTVFNTLVLKPWPVKDPGRVVIVFPQSRSGGFSPLEYRYLAEQTRTMSGLAATNEWAVHFGFEGFGKGTRGKLVSANYFRVLGIPMEIGRGFLPEEDRVDAPRNVAVLKYTFWRDHFGEDREVVGSEVRLDGVPFTIVGVASRDFAGIEPGKEDFWLPFAVAPVLQKEYSVADFLLNPSHCCTDVIGRLAPSASRPTAEAELSVLSRQFDGEFHLEARGVVLTGTTFFERPGSKREILPMISLMFLGLALVLLLACANVGNLLVARAAARQREIEMRRALGASRARIVRQLLTESLVLAFGASALGVSLAYRLPELVLNWIGQPAPVRLLPDATVLFYAGTLAVFACLAFGLAPAFHGTRPQSNARLPLRNFLLAVQVGLSLVLLVSAGLLVEGIRRARSQDPGFAVAGVSVISFELPAASYDAPRTGAFYAQLLNDLSQVPGLGTFGIAIHEPLSNSHSITSVWLPGSPQPVIAVVQDVSPGYFDVLRIPLLAGRNFDASSDSILVNETFARRFWSDEIPLGKTIMVERSPRQIIGVVKDAYTTRLDRIEPTLYRPYAGHGIPKLLVRPATGAPANLVVAATAAIDPRIRTQVTPLSENLDLSLASPRAGAEIAGMLGVFALILATVGMAGVFAYVVQQRTKEIGIRIALGARPAQVVGLVLWGSSRAVLIGLGAGLLTALPLSLLLRNQLFGVSPFDPRAYAAVGVLLSAAALLASYAPARRASRLDPLAALRHE